MLPRERDVLRGDVEVLRFTWLAGVEVRNSEFDSYCWYEERDWKTGKQHGKVENLCLRSPLMYARYLSPLSDRFPPSFSSLLTLYGRRKEP